MERCKNVFEAILKYGHDEDWLPVPEAKFDSTDAPAGSGWIARYAWGDDYHDVMKAMLARLARGLEAEIGPFRSRAYVDTGPIVERAYAAAAGLGAWGKNTCLLHPEHGSWFFLGELVTDLEMLPDAPRPDMCGSCTACKPCSSMASSPVCRPYVRSRHKATVSACAQIQERGSPGASLCARRPTATATWA